MNKYLMDYCLNYGKEACNDQVKKARMPKEIQQGEPIPAWPVGKEQDKLDDICEKCDSRYFEIRKKECLVCGNEEFQKEIKDIKISDEKNTLKAEVSFMECSRCKSKLKLIKQY